VLAISSGHLTEDFSVLRNISFFLTEVMFATAVPICMGNHLMVVGADILANL
jgi:hypothetical protein